ncbi:MAG: 3-oxoacyl-[acyl-carrier-protein] reductase [Alphaproteobacteria bacterium]
MFSLKNKTALVTGASGGIGAAIACALHKAGAHVVISGTRLAAMESLQAQLKDRVAIIQADLMDTAVTANLVERAEAMTGSIDILVNNAGMTRDGLLLRMKDEDWQSVLDVNLTAGFRLARAAVKGMMKRRWGRIRGLSSVVGVIGNPGQANYVASKAGMIGFTKALAQEVASRGITANTIAPGFIDTPMTNALTEAQKATILAKIPMGRLGSIDDIGHAAVYLASEEAGYMTGQTLNVNGGMAMI